MSLTDLHKGTHNCAAAIRESGAGISPSNPPLPSRRRRRRCPLRPRLSRQPARSAPPSSTLSPPPWPAERGDGARALSQCAAIIFPHEWAAVSVVPGLVLRCSCCIFYPSPSRSLSLSLSFAICPSVALLLPRRGRFSDTFGRKNHLVGREYFSLI